MFNVIGIIVIGVITDNDIGLVDDVFKKAQAVDVGYGKFLIRIDHEYALNQLGIMPYQILPQFTVSVRKIVDKPSIRVLNLARYAISVDLHKRKSTIFMPGMIVTLTRGLLYQIDEIKNKV